MPKLDKGMEIHGQHFFHVRQISSAGYDPVVHTLAILSTIYFFAGTAYAGAMIMMFGRLETEADRRDWIRAAHDGVRVIGLGSRRMEGEEGIQLLDDACDN
ncbi:hypothetical protein C8R45DRAFT_941038 [Mycena sanguinolenta]|nr:hypothetical protein C8R45DRAFT_941038 [Mycena sanguinolenta]